MATPQLPTQFPCWVKAIYSWGGETKRDLGFIEGDLIECLNAGDGSWWMGRLRRDRRMVGLFPSNFVQVLDQSTIVPSRQVSPLPLRNSSSASQSPAPVTPTPQKTKSVFRRPFSAHYAAESPGTPGSGTPSPSGSVSKTLKPYSSMRLAKNTPTPPQKTFIRPQSPTIPAPVPRASGSARSRHASSISRASSPQPPSHRQDSQQRRDSSTISRAASPQPHRQSHLYRQESAHIPRAASPQPPMHSYLPQQDYRQESTHIPRATSPRPPVHSYTPQQDHGYTVDDQDDGSPPPPPPPTHRFAQTRPGTPCQPIPQQHTGRDEYRISRAPSPAMSNSGGHTPSPLRDAMNDVMSSLEGMSTAQNSQEEAPSSPADIWSPEAFNEVYNVSARSARPHTSLGLRGQTDLSPGEEDTEDVTSYSQPTAGGRHSFSQSYRQDEEAYRNLNMHNLDEAHADGDRVEDDPMPPQPPPKSAHYPPPSSSVYSSRSAPQRSHSRNRPGSQAGSIKGNSPFDLNRRPSRRLQAQKSASELGNRLVRTMTLKSSTTDSTTPSAATNSSHSTQITNQSLMSGASAGQFSATSAGSYARRRFEDRFDIKPQPSRPMSMYEHRSGNVPSDVSFHSSHESRPPMSPRKESDTSNDGVLGGLSEPVLKKRGFFKKMIASAKTSAANARSTISTGSNSRPQSRDKSAIPDGVTAISGGLAFNSPARGLGRSDSVDWMQMRRDTNRSNSLSRNERSDRAERCQMLDFNVINPADILQETVEGDESADGYAVRDPTDFNAANLQLVDKNARFVSNLPGTITPTALAQAFLCRQYRGDVQKLRAIFTWVAERLSWEDAYEGDPDTRRLITSRRGCSEEIAYLVYEMATAVGIQAEVIRGHLKEAREIVTAHDLNEIAARPNHWWNGVNVDGEWRIMDCSLANPTNPRRLEFSSVGSQAADGFWFLTRPVEICYTHVPLLPEQQHMVPSLPHDVLMALPVASPTFFKSRMQMSDFDTSLLFLEGLEMAHFHVIVPEDIECVAEVEARAFASDADGDLFESGDVVTKRALAQAEFIRLSEGPSQGEMIKRYTIKAVLPSQPNSSNDAVLKIYAGRRGLMHGITKNPHPLALTIPLQHQGQNPDYEFFTRHPTPHALKHEIYVVGPQCRRLAFNSTFVFGARQHPAMPFSNSTGGLEKRPGSPSIYGRAASALSIQRPGSAMSMASISASGSNYSNPSTTGSESSNGSSSTNSSLDNKKPAKLAIQSPSGKIIRMTRKPDQRSPTSDDEGIEKLGSAWETFIKVGERGVWRGLVLADRSARWCVFGEWECL